MADKFKSLPSKMILVALAVTLAAQLSFAGPGLSPPAAKLERQPVNSLWHVKYMGGPNSLKRGTRVDLRITESTISYGTPGVRQGSNSSISVADVTDVSDAVIEGDRSENMFGPDEPDFITPCGKVRDPIGGQACLMGGIALETPFAIVKSILMEMPFKDRFVRVAWHREGGNPTVVFKVSGKDFVPLQEELERVTAKAVDNHDRAEIPQIVIDDGAVTHFEAFDRETARLRTEGWLNALCKSDLRGKPW